MCNKPSPLGERLGGNQSLQINAIVFGTAFRKDVKPMYMYILDNRY